MPRSARASGASLAVIPSERSESRDLHPAGRYYGNVISRGVRGGARSSRRLCSRILRNGRGASTHHRATILWRGARGGTRSRGGLLSGSRSPSQLGPPLHPRPQNQGLWGRHSAGRGGAARLGPPRTPRAVARVAYDGAPLRELRVKLRRVDASATMLAEFVRSVRALPERRIAAEEELYPERLLADEDGLVEEDVGADHLGRHRPLAAAR